MKVNYNEGRSGFFSLAKENLTISSASFEGGFVLVKAKGATSYFDAIKDTTIIGGVAIDTETPVYLDGWKSAEDNPLAEGDVVVAMNPSISCWTTDSPYSPSEGEIDRTSQCDFINHRKDISGDGVITETGTINGYYETEASIQREIEARFTDTIEHTYAENGAVKVTMRPQSNSEPMWHFMITKNADPGDVLITKIRLMRISGYSAGLPSSGAVPFNFNYTTLKSFSYNREIK